MGILDTLSLLFRGRRKQEYRAKKGPYLSVNDFGGSRTTSPRFALSGMPSGILPKRVLRDLRIDERTLSRTTLDQLIDILIDAHPDMSFALWNYVRLSNSGYTVYAFKPGTDEIDSNATLLIKELVERLNQPSLERFTVSRSLDSVVNQLIISTIIRGAAALELVLTKDKRDVAFIAPVDPATVVFKFENDRFVPYQGDGTISLDVPTFFYEALDNLIDIPYGRSPIIGAIQMIAFQMQLLNDIAAVVHNQGYPRFDITILEDAILQRMPPHIRNNEAERQKWLNQKLQEIVEMYESLDPDDAFVHYSSVKIDMAGGGKNGGAMIDPQKLMSAIDNLIMSGLKTLSTILGRRSHGNTESFAKMEVKLYLKGVESVQDVVERILSRALTLYLNIRGVQGVVKFEFKPVDIRTELEKAQFEQIHLMNIAFKRDQGWITQDEAARMAVGHDAVGEPMLTKMPKNKDGGPVKGATDEKGPDSPTEQP